MDYTAIIGVLLTLMSIHTSIRWAVNDGRLHEFKPLPLKATRLREMFIAQDLFVELTKIRATSVETMRFANLESDPAVFVHSPTISPKYLFRLAPRRDRVWEIRSTMPLPQFRVLGLFARKDIFIATNLALRNDLGVFDSKEWRTEKRRAIAQWRRLFPFHDAQADTDVSQLVSGAISGKYFINRPAH